MEGGRQDSPSAYGYIAPYDSSDAAAMQWKYGAMDPVATCKNEKGAAVQTPGALGPSPRPDPWRLGGRRGLRQTVTTARMW